MNVLIIPLFHCQSPLLDSSAVAEIKNIRMPWKFAATLLLVDETFGDCAVFSFGKVVRRQVPACSEIESAAVAIVAAMEWFATTTYEKCCFAVACTDDHACECLSRSMHTECDMCFVPLIDTHDSESFTAIPLPHYNGKGDANDAGENPPSGWPENSDSDDECNCNFFMEKFATYASSPSLALTPRRNTRISSSAYPLDSETTHVRSS